jgi:hypothetical protein
VLLVVYSFGASGLVTVWAGFSTRWYGELARSESFRAAALTSFEVAAMSANLLLVLGGFAGLGESRFARFRGRLLFGFALMAPLVVPEVILGLSRLGCWLVWSADDRALSLGLPSAPGLSCPARNSRQMLQPSFEDHVEPRFRGTFDTAEPAGSDNRAQFRLAGLRAERGANLLR